MIASASREARISRSIVSSSTSDRPCAVACFSVPV